MHANWLWLIGAFVLGGMFFVPLKAAVTGILGR